MKKRNFLLFVFSIVVICVSGQQNYHAEFSAIRPQVNNQDYITFIENIPNSSVEDQYVVLDSLSQLSLNKKDYVDYLFYKNQLTRWYFNNGDYNNAFRTSLESRKLFAEKHDTLHVEYLVSYTFFSFVHESYRGKKDESFEQVLLHRLHLAEALRYDTLTIKDNPYLSALEALIINYTVGDKDKFFFYTERLRNKCKEIGYLGGISRADGFIHELIYSADDLYDATSTAIRLMNKRLEPELDNPAARREQTAHFKNSYQLGLQTYLFKNYDKAIPLFKSVAEKHWSSATAAFIIMANIKLAWCYSKLNDSLNYQKQVDKCLSIIKSDDVTEFNQAYIYLNLAEGIADTHPELCHSLFDSSLTIYKKYNNYHRALCAKFVAYFDQGEYQKAIEITEDNFPFDSITQTLKIDEYINYYEIFYFWTQTLMKSYYELWKDSGDEKYFAGYENYMLKTLSLLEHNEEQQLGSHQYRSIQGFFNKVIDPYLLVPYANGEQFKKITQETIIDAISLSKQNAIANSAQRLSESKNKESYADLYEYLDNLNEIQKQQVYLNSLADSLVTDADIWRLSDLLYENAKYRYEINKISKNAPDINEIPPLANVNEIKETLSNEQAILDFYETDSLIYCSVITCDTAIVTYSNTQQFKELSRGLIRGVKTGNSSSEVKHEISRLLLSNIKPVIDNKSKLIIVPNKWLYNIPFEVLIYSEEKGEKLIEKFNVSYNYSYQIWAANQHHNVSKEKSLLAIAPVFGQVNNQRLNDTDTLLLADEYRGNAELSPLPFSEKEVEQVQNVFKQNSLNNKLLISESATEENFYSDFENYTIIHFATHGLSNKEHFERSGIFLYQNGSDKQSASDRDNYLSLGEVYALDYQPDLVVLSACKTGTGKIVEGEGVMALPRGFIYAGVPNVIASLWKVHDEKTKDLMVAFYKHLLEDKVSYAEALRLAKLDCIEKGFLPIDWAGFILIGN